VDAALVATGLHLTAWSFVAFWLWLGLGLLFRRLRLPQGLAVAAVLSCVAAGLWLRWLLPLVLAWLAPHLHVPDGRLSMR